jgi:hypothetical protein
MNIDYIPIDRLSVSKANMRQGKKPPDVSDILQEDGACAPAFLIGPENARRAALPARGTGNGERGTGKANDLDKVRNIHYTLLRDGGAVGR